MHHLGQVVYGMQNPVNPQSHHACIAFWFNMYITGTLLKGVAEKMVYRAFYVLVRGGNLFGRGNLYILLKVAKIDYRPCHMIFSCRNGCLEAEKLSQHSANI
jgi:hypothetical protein